MSEPIQIRILHAFNVYMLFLSVVCFVQAVESDHCDAFKQSFDKKELVTVDVKSTLADGLAVSRLGTRSFMTASHHVDRVVTVR